MCLKFGLPVKQLRWLGVKCEAWGKPGTDACMEGETCVDGKLGSLSVVEVVGCAVVVATEEGDCEGDHEGEVVDKKGCECMWKDACVHDGVMACAGASDWKGHKCVAWVSCDDWRCMEA